MPEENPVVSVVITVYNAEKFIERTLRSVMNQTIKNIEIICVNDCSIDKSEEIIKILMQEDDRIVLLNNEQNLKVSQTRNKGINYAHAKFIALLDSDDEWKENFLIAMLERQKETGGRVIYSACSFMTSDGTYLPATFIPKDKVTYKEYFKQNIIPPSGSLIERELLIKYPFYADKVHEDYVCFLSILKEIKVAYGIKEPLMIYRLTDGSKSRNKFKAILMSYRTYKIHGVSFFRRCFYTICNAINGIKKYGKINKVKREFLKERENKNGQS